MTTPDWAQALALRSFRGRPIGRRGQRSASRFCSGESSRRRWLPAPAASCSWSHSSVGLERCAMNEKNDPHGAKPTPPPAAGTPDDRSAKLDQSVDDSEVRPSTPAELDRRRFLSKVSVTLGVVGGAALSVPGVIFVVAPLLSDTPSEWRAVGKVDSFQIGATVNVVFLDSSPLPWAGVTAKTAAWLRRTTEQEFIAFSVNCAHLGCPVRWLESARLFMCPCHGGVYYEDGRVAAGPPPHGLTPVSCARPRRRGRDLHPTDPDRMTMFKRLLSRAWKTIDDRIGLTSLLRPILDPPCAARCALVVRVRQRHAVRVHHSGAEWCHPRVFLHCVVVAGLRDAALHHQPRAARARLARASLLWRLGDGADGGHPPRPGVPGRLVQIPAGDELALRASFCWR